MVYVGNVTGRALRSAEAISEDLASNIAHGVRWYDATTVLEELGCRLFLEMPPGHVLSELAREAFPDVRTLAIGAASFKHALLLASQFGLRFQAEGSRSSDRRSGHVRSIDKHICKPNRSLQEE
jgi:acyl transferase domain-containing protein